MAAHSCSDVKIPIALKLLTASSKSLEFTTMIILCLFSNIRSITCPIEVVVVTQGGGLLIIVQSGASNWIRINNADVISAKRKTKRA